MVIADDPRFQRANEVMKVDPRAGRALAHRLNSEIAAAEGERCAELRTKAPRAARRAKGRG